MKIPAPDLTSSELRLLPLLMTELSFKEIAQRLKMPDDEALAQIKSIYTKLGLSAEGKRSHTDL